MPLILYLACNAPTGVKGQTLAKKVRLLGKSTRSYGKPSDEVSLVRRWTSKLGCCLNTTVQEEFVTAKLEVPRGSIARVTKVTGFQANGDCGVDCGGRGYALGP